MKTIAKIIIPLVALVAVGAATNIVNRFELPAAKVTVRVVDENQQPVENAKISLGFGDTSVEGTTDTNGLFTGEGRCGIAGMGSTIKKNGYYLGSAPIPRFSEHDEILNRWKPWNDTYTAILRPIIKPVALYSKIEWIEIPVIGSPCGYDLEKGDWVSPYGAGMIPDLIFHLQRLYISRDDFDVKVEVTFSQPLDGIQEIQWPEIGHNSIFKWPREAPENGYNPTLTSSLMSDSHGYHATASEKQGYFFRVRAVEQGNKIISANYGKIKGGIELAPSNSKTCLAKLTYYYNPASLERNLEWDTKRNLFVNLGWEKTPKMP
jgi:hypothetical protein